MFEDTIVAPATANGRSALSIVRVSGPLVPTITKQILKKKPKARHVCYSPFYDENDIPIDVGIALLFKNPHSFTGEDLLELQGHGGLVVVDTLIKRIIQLGARLANPGEFSRRAFLNNKIDLAQAEAIADLIDSASSQAARSAVASLQGDFSKQINDIVAKLIKLRTFVEATLDFPDEDVDYLTDGSIAMEIQTIIQQIETLTTKAKQGVALREGLKVVLVGKPNVGKSSLLNTLSGYESAIVSDIPGTTRDIIKENISIDGLPLHIIDTAGLRDSDEPIEQEGMRRAWQSMMMADRILYLCEATETYHQDFNFFCSEIEQQQINKKNITIIRNKIDLLNEQAYQVVENNITTISISVKTGRGLDLLKDHLKNCAGYASNEEGGFIARRRHVNALQKALEYLLLSQAYVANSLNHQKTKTNNEQSTKKQTRVSNISLELLAEELRCAQNQLSEITGQFSADDLLGEIFTTFCIGK